MQKIYFSLVLILLLPFIAAQDLYVDQNSVNGQCSNSYTRAQNNLQHPWCNIATANSLHQSGDKVFILPGEYREILLPKNGVNNNQRTIYSGYGAREDVKIIGSNEITGWTLTSGNVYQASFTAPTRCEGRRTTNCWEDRQRWLKKVNNLAAVNSAGKFYYDGTTVYAWPFSGNPSDHKIECSTRKPVYWGEYEGSSNGPTQYVTLQNLTIMQSHSRGITLHYNTKDLTITNNEIMFNTGCGSLYENPGGIHKESRDPPLLGGLHIIGNKVHDQGTDTGYNGPSESEHEGFGIELYSVRDAIIENNEVYNAPMGIYLKSGDGSTNYYNVTIKGNIVHDVGYGIGLGASEVQLSSLYSATIEKNIVYDTGIYPGIFVKGVVNNDFNKGKINQNTLYNTGGIGLGVTYQDEIPSAGFYERMNITNNIIMDVNSVNAGSWDWGNNAYFKFSAKTSPNTYSDYNLLFATGQYFGITSTRGFYNPSQIVNYATLSDWRSGTNHDLFSTEENPLFFNAAGHDFHLQSNSPAIDTGIKIAGFHCARADNDPINPYPSSDGNCRHYCGTNPDKGAIEYCGAYVPTPTPSPSPSPSPTPTPSPSPSPSIIPSPTPSPSPSIIPSATPSSSVSILPSASPSISPSPTACAPAISVDSTYSGYPTSVIDNDFIDANGGTSTTWASGESTTSPHYIEKQYCNPVTINNATIWWAYNDFSGQFATSQIVQVQYYSGSGWQTAAPLPYPGANRASSTVSFAPVSAARWRFYQPANQGATTYPSVMWLTEIDFKQGTAIPSPSITPSPSVTGTPMPSTTPSPSVIPSVSVIPSISPSPSPSTIPCTENWSCTDWSACSNGTQTQVCLDLNSCGTIINKPADSQSCNVTVSPSPSVSINPSASVIPCTENWSCTGFNACSGGTQSQLCTDANNCATTANRPPLTQGCTMPSTGGGLPGGSGGYYAGPGAYVSPPKTTASVKANPSPSVSVKPSATIPPSVQFVTIKSEIETSLPDLSNEGQDEIQQLLDEAERLQKTGNTQQALVLLNRAKTRLNDLKTKKADYPWQLGLIGLTILIGIGIYYFKARAK